MKTADMMIKILESEGVEYIFGIPGGAIEDLNIAIFNSDQIKPIVCRHETGAAFMADGYARVSGKLGVCCATSGPGASNLITGLATAHGDYIPVLSLTGQVAVSLFGRGAFQESGAEGVHIVNIFRNFTKYSCMLHVEDRAQYILQKSIRMAHSIPSGPVHISMPVDIMKKEVSPELQKIFRFEGGAFDREGVNDTTELLLSAKRPVIIAGWGVVLARAADALLEVAELLDIPVATSPKAKGVFPESHPLSLGVIGYAGSPVASEYIIDGEVDVLLAVGTSFNEVMTSGWDDRLAPTEHLIHIDADSKKIGKNYPTSLGVIGDVKTVLTEIHYSLKRRFLAENDARILREVDRRRLESKSEVEQLKSEYASNEAGFIGEEEKYHPRQLIQDIQTYFPDNTIYFADIGSSLAWALRYMEIDRPYSFYSALGYGPLGYATAAAVGASIALKDTPVVALSGDGSFLMNGFEVSTAVHYGLPVIWVVLNNAMFGILHHQRRKSLKKPRDGISSRFKPVDFAKIAQGLGARGIRIRRPKDLKPELIANILSAGRPTVLDVIVDEDAPPPMRNRV